jgi:hypothetical protein
MDVTTMMDVFVSYGFETDDEMTDDRKIEALNETYWDVCGREDWPFLEAYENFTIDPTTGAITLPSGNDLGAVQAIWFSTSGRVLSPKRFDDLNQDSPQWRATPGTPVFYYFLADDLFVAPIPTADPGDGYITYLRVPAELTSTSVTANILLPKRYHRSVLVVGTLAKLAVMQDDVDMGNAYERLYEKAIALMQDDLFKQQTDRPDYIHVNDPDNWDYS